jgi:hypothetical protein
MDAPVLAVGVNGAEGVVWGIKKAKKMGTPIRVAHSPAKRITIMLLVQQKQYFTLKTKVCGA